MTALVALAMLLIRESDSGPPSQDNPEPVTKLLQLRCAAAERIADRFLLDLTRSLLQHEGKQPSVPIEPALRRLFEAQRVVAENPQSRLMVAQRYGRHATLYFWGERQRFEIGAIAAADPDLKGPYFMHDAAIEIAKARRELGLTESIATNVGWMPSEFTIKSVIRDLLTLVAAFNYPEKQPDDDGAIAIPNEAIEALKPFGPPSRDREMEFLLDQRNAAASRSLTRHVQVFQAGPKGSTLASLFDALTCRLTAELELSDKLIDQVKAHDRAFVISKFVEAVCKKRFELGQITSNDLDLARFHRLDHQIQWIRAKDRLLAETKPKP
jgi:hypothetical protein